MVERIIITDFTEMSKGSYCIAGWDCTSGRMTRLLTSYGGNWNDHLIQKTRLWNRRLVEFNRVRMPNARAFPHASEDTFVDENSIRVFSRPRDWRDLFRASEQPDIDSIFNGHLSGIGQPYVRKSPMIAPDTHCVSLGATRARSSDFTFYENTYDPNKVKLRCRFRDSISSFDLPVSSYRLRLRWRDIGIVEMNRRQGTFGNVHVRVGLARPFNNGCFLMLNGLYRADDH